MTQMKKQISEQHRDPQTYAIIGAAMRVHAELGPGFLESAYQEALAVEMEWAEIPFRREVMVPIQYRGRPLDTHFRADFIYYEAVVVETKAQKSVGDAEAAQVLNYLKATGLKRALLLNFGEPHLLHRRYVL